MALRAEIGYLVREFRDVVFDENVRFNPAELYTLVVPAIHDAVFWNTEIEESESRRLRSDLDEFSLQPDVTKIEQLRRSSEGHPKKLRNTSAPEQSENQAVHNDDICVMEKTPPPMMTPSLTPTLAASPNELPGVFPTESRPISHEPEGVGHYTSDPVQQLYTESSSTPLSNPPLGYRLRGEVVSRNIDLSLLRSNIIEGKRKRAYFAATEELVELTELIEEDEIHDGVLVAFTAGLTQ
ncbi:hypothetical protein N7449_005084 [Penicillium cf. viridicatum]|uniref:Uncharacterized protein n=1 Tax=Penicillium cf. viridicatum TaxID=2972119 RepID=A0A9W9MKS3_9EURO|nr:hypothetical protein N7449_005084 [Penicillium cf. viridicatum]